MKHLINLVAALTLVLWMQPGKAQFRQTPEVEVTWYARVADAKDFDFSRLSFHVLYKSREEDQWKSSGFITADKNGSFHLTLPAGSRIRMEVATSDPTLEHLGIDAGYHSITENGWGDIAWLDFSVPSSADMKVDFAINLSRGSAVKLCLPSGIRSGTVSFWMKSVPLRKRRINASIFYDPQAFAGRILAGLKPGRWAFLVTDSAGRRRLSKTLDLKPGQILRENCRPNDQTRSDKLSRKVEA